MQYDTETTTETTSTRMTLTFFVPFSEDDDGEPTGWTIHCTEPAELLAETPTTMTFRSTDVLTGKLYDWDAYRYDFGNDWGEQWAYGSSAELLTFSRTRSA